MTSEAPPDADRAALEGTLEELALFEVLELLGRGRHTGTLYIAGSRPAAITVVDGEVSFATNDPSWSLREVLISRSVVDDDGWHEAVQAKDVDLGAALSAGSASRAAEVRAVVHEHILSTVFDLSDVMDGRFRFVLGSRHSMGQGYAYPIDRLRADVVSRGDAWRAIADVVPDPSVIVQLHDRPPAGDTIVCVAATDWPLVVALDGRRALSDLIEPTGMASFAICEAAHRLVTAGLASVVDPESY